MQSFGSTCVLNNMMGGWLGQGVPGRHCKSA